MKNTIKILFFITVNTVFSQQAITDTGTNVGIGTTTPDSESRLHVASPSGVTDFTILATSVGVNNWSGFYQDALNNFKIQARDGSGILKASIASSGDSWLNGGDVGIGTTTPASKLEVKSTNNLRTLLNFNDQSSITFMPNNGNSVFHISHGLSNNLHISQGVNPGDGKLMTITNDGRVGIGTAKPFQKLHVNGNIGIGLMAETEAEGFRIDYVDGGSGTTTFKNNRWGGDIYFKRNSSQGERNQFLFGGAGDHYLNIYNSNNEVKVRFVSGGNSYLNGGNVGIGTTNPGIWKLAVNGNIRAKEIKVETGWSDFVFENNYSLPTLKEVEQHIKDKGHLKDIPSAEEVKENGIFLGEMNSKLLQKIEELTLYTIEQQKEIENSEKEIKAQNNKIEKLEKENEELQSLSKRLAEIEKLLNVKKQ